MSLLRSAAALMVTLALAAAPALAQDTTLVVPDTLVAPDTAAPDTTTPDPIVPLEPAAADTIPPGHIGPMGAFWRSFLLPGWGQAALGRRTAAGIFVAVEGATLVMTVKTMREVSYLSSVGSQRLDDKRQEREDWLVLLAFNHLLSGLEAYVSAQLWDFPGDLTLRRMPDGAAAEVSIPLRVR